VNETPQWGGKAYQSSLSSRCWWYTPWDGAEWNEAVAADNEVREIVAMELALGEIPDWARRSVEITIRMTQPCGHYLLPRGFLEAISAIGAELIPSFVHGCYAVETTRKRQMMDYIFCLDAWLAGASSGAAARELMALGARRIDWPAVCADLWSVLGDHTEMKDLLIERLVHAQRVKVKFSPWDDDRGTKFGRDEYLGDITEVSEAQENGYIEGYIPGCNELASPRVQRMEARLSEICPAWEEYRSYITYGWLCAPKAFRYLERLLWAIGHERIGTPLMPSNEDVPDFLQIADTVPNQDEAALWWRLFCEALDAWWRGQPVTANSVAGDVNRRLGGATPVKQWLVRLLLKKLKMLEANGEEFTRLVNPPPHAFRGTRPITS